MLQKYKSKREEGFTIIEVLIVLAIAGLIILIVFLAVPALQRNSRNTSRREDVSRIGGAVQEIINNNNGSMAAVDTASLTAAVGTDKLAYYQSASVTVVAGDQTNPDDPDSVLVVTGAECSGDNTVANTSRRSAVLFTVETGNGTDMICQEI